MRRYLRIMRRHLVHYETLLCTLLGEAQSSLHRIPTAARPLLQPCTGTRMTRMTVLITLIPMSPHLDTAHYVMVMLLGLEPLALSCVGLELPPFLPWVTCQPALAVCLRGCRLASHLVTRLTT